jgi:Domain of unknown function (DUF4919)
MNADMIWFPTCRWLSSLSVAFAVVMAPSFAMGAEQDDATYRALVQRVESGDFTIDFRSLRMACVRSSLCEPRGTKADLGALNRADNDHEFDKVAEVAEKLISKGFVNIEAHANCVGAYAQLHNTVKSKFHQDVTTELLRSILNSGDGKTKQTAFEVICDREEYDTLSALGLPYFGPSVSSTTVEDGEHHYDRWEVRHPQTGQMVVLFFNTDAFSPTKSRVGKE